MMMNTSCPHVEEAGKVVCTARLLSTWDTPWPSLKFVRNSCRTTCAPELVKLHDNLPFCVSRSAKFLPSAGKTKIPCGSFTSEVTIVDDQAFLKMATAVWHPLLSGNSQGRLALAVETGFSCAVSFPGWPAFCPVDFVVLTVPVGCVLSIPPGLVVVGGAPRISQLLSLPRDRSAFYV